MRVRDQSCSLAFRPLLEYSEEVRAWLSIRRVHIRKRVQALQARETVLNGRYQKFEQRLRRHLRTDFNEKKLQSAVRVRTTIFHGAFNGVFSGECLRLP